MIPFLSEMFPFVYVQTPGILISDFPDGFLKSYGVISMVNTVPSDAVDVKVAGETGATKTTATINTAETISFIGALLP